MTTENTHELIFFVACYSPLSSSLGVVIREQAALFWGHYPQRQSRSRWQFIGEKSPLRCPLYRVAGKFVRKYTLSPNPCQFNRLQRHYAKFSTRCCGTPWG
jgi:hypothetical protein